MDNPIGQILLVDDDRQLVSLLKAYLEQEGFRVHAVYDGQAALELVQDSAQFSVIVLDIMMPGINGLDVLQMLRQRISTPVLMLTGRGDEIDRIIGLEMGADDYLAKPCNPRELLARIRAILRRTRLDLSFAEQTLQPVELHGLSLDPGKRELRYRQQVLDLTGAEFNVLSILMRSAGRVISKQELTRQVLHREMTAYDRSIDVHVSRLRRKLEAVAANADGNELIKTVRGEGYQFVG